MADALIEKLANRLTYFQFLELSALQTMNDAIHGPSFIHKSNYRGLYQSLVRLDLVDWGPPPADMSPRRFAGTSITDLGRKVLARIAEIDEGEGYSDD